MNHSSHLRSARTSRRVLDRVFGTVTVLVLLAGSSPRVEAQTPDTAGAQFIRWARTAAHPLLTLEPNRDWSDLEPLGRAIGDARVVALSEAVHEGHEPLAFRNRLFQFLVERRGYTAIAIESGISESRIAHRFARGDAVDRQVAIDSGFSWTFQLAPENAALLDWIRLYNADPHHRRKLSFYGFDVPGSPGNVNAARRMQAALDDALAYLDRVDSSAAGALRARLAPYLDLARRTGFSDYAAFPDSVRDRITAALVDLAARIERHGPAYAAATSEDEYQWSRRNTAGARQIDGWLRRIPVGTPRRVAGQPAPAWMFDAAAYRDAGQAENIGWILDREGRDGRLLMFASVSHVSTAPIRVAGREPSTPAGMHIRQALGASLVTIGNLLGGGQSGCAPTLSPIAQRSDPTMDRWAGEATPGPHFLDLRAAPVALRDWLASQQPFGGTADVVRTEPSRAFDLLLYYPRVTPICPAVSK